MQVSKKQCLEAGQEIVATMTEMYGFAEAEKQTVLLCDAINGDGGTSDSTVWVAMGMVKAILFKNKS